MKQRIVAVLGPTAVGKTEYAIRLAEDLGGEIVSCDSMQLYRYMDIGSAKATSEEQKRVPHHMIDVADPREPFSAARYKLLAEDAIEDIAGRGKLPIITGGTGLYLDALLFDLDFAAEPERDPKIREELYAIAENQGPEALHRILTEEDPAAAARIHPHNIKRVVRAIESARAGEKIRDFATELTYSDRYDPLIVGLFRDREELYDRIDRRVDLLLEQGLVEEVRRLSEMGLTEDDISMKGIGYKELFPYLRGECSLEEAADLIKKNTRHYAKRQGTWLKRYQNMQRFDLSAYPNGEAALEEIETWLKSALSSTTKATNPTT
ncbi:MAG: tRNA (adenosine(37)-N6)-dimethylallyltransferase MiaA [Eubacterium sp.]|nr:tRNA (adenosine(37)-N6)-dimethylallyltransferase MiaA [Eubacterium sp.]